MKTLNHYNIKLTYKSLASIIPNLLLKLCNAFASNLSSNCLGSMAESPCLFFRSRDPQTARTGQLISLLKKKKTEPAVRGSLFMRLFWSRDGSKSSKISIEKWTSYWDILTRLVFKGVISRKVHGFYQDLSRFIRIYRLKSNYCQLNAKTCLFMSKVMNMNFILLVR